MRDDRAGSIDVAPDEVAGSEFRVVVNHDGQYSIWPLGRPVPEGWLVEGTAGSEQDCLNRIEAVWTDMRPISLLGGQRG